MLVVSNRTKSLLERVNKFIYGEQNPTIRQEILWDVNPRWSRSTARHESPHIPIQTCIQCSVLCSYITLH